MGKHRTTAPSHSKDTASRSAARLHARANPKTQASVLVSPGKRDEIIREAYKVFYREGFHAAGVDQVLAGTGISKRTLYKYFESKEDLIEATIDHYGAQLSRSLDAFILESKSKTAIEKALSVFDWLEDLVESGHLYGCFAINAKIEYSQKGPGIEAACALQFTRFENLCVALCRECKVKNVRKTSCQLRTIFQGATVIGQTTGSALAIQNAKSVARMLLENSM